ncbi:MAG: permease [Candidatus Coatesbacteria bacterium]|nr:permease [Candidatus Coatesbacteria bacterium]
MKNWTKALLIVGVFLLFYLLPLGGERVRDAAGEAVTMVQDYARNHFPSGMLPAFVIAGALAAFVPRRAILKYLGAGAKKVIAYGVASVSGALLAVCSCTILPLFAGIYSRGAGLGPAVTFLYAGPAINVAAILVTATVLGPELGLARAVGAIVFSIVIGLLMSVLFRREEDRRQTELQRQDDPQAAEGPRELASAKLVSLFVALLAFMILLNWRSGLIADNRWLFAGGAALVVLVPAFFWLKKEHWRLWGEETWDFVGRIVPLLFLGVIIAGFLVGRPGAEGLIPAAWIEAAVGGNTLLANLLASAAGALIYFCTLTEVPVLQALLGAGMGGGPALAMLLAGPALSLPNMIVIRSVLGTKKTAVYLVLVVVFSTITGYLFGLLYPTITVA